MAGNDLRIRITGTLNSNATVSEINTQLKSIENKIHKLKLKVQLDQNQVKELSKLQNALQRSSKTNMVSNKDVSAAKEIYTSLDRAVEKYSKLGSVKISQNFNPMTKELEKFQLTVTRANGEVEKLKFELASLKGMKGINGFALTGRSTNDNTAAIRERQLQQEQAINRQIVQRTQTLRNQLEIYKRQAELQANNLKNNRNKVLSDEQQTSLRNYLNNINALNASTPNLQQKMRQLSLDFREISSQAQNASQGAINLGNAFQQAFTKFPIWMLTSTAFFAPLQAMESMVSRLIEIDTLMTDINRVMDIPEFELANILDEAVIASDELSSKLTDVLKMVGEFGRMGFQENELMDITKTAQVLQNISDLNATDAVNTLTSAMLNYNIAASESVKISDMLNEVDNNFAISTKDLSDGIRKAASTSKTFGVDLQELVGYIAAIGSTTRESGAIIGNGLKTIISRITTMDDARGALESVNISLNDMSGNVKPVSDILSELASRWSSLSDQQRQNMGVTLAGRYQLSR
ncbi:phage tail tape measure protein [Bacillus sp. T33-2]|uniref:phage tail tape measure protein n=1 Tax=Bacillus sp. T33-2 TaxID=2054168 RepID=UPI000C7789B1|nr:phage tail tape measure protein [Bacillus sp. T33-2]PLR99650.1 phage tail tape measure protein [Bacillus sp. T33-2]